MKSLPIVFKNHRTGNKPTPNRPLVARVIGFDTAEVRRYFGELESLAQEAKRTRDPRVMDLALRLVARQAKTIRELGVEI